MHRTDRGEPQPRQRLVEPVGDPWMPATACCVPSTDAATCTLTSSTLAMTVPSSVEDRRNRPTPMQVTRTGARHTAAPRIGVRSVRPGPPPKTKPMVTQPSPNASTGISQTPDDRPAVPGVGRRRSGTASSGRAVPPPRTGRRRAGCASTGVHGAEPARPQHRRVGGVRRGAGLLQRGEDRGRSAGDGLRRPRPARAAAASGRPRVRRGRVPAGRAAGPGVRVPPRVPAGRPGRSAPARSRRCSRPGGPRRDAAAAAR